MKKLCIICAAACLLLSGCGRNNESAAPSAASGQSSALSAAENQSTANQTAESDRSKTAAFCELLEKRCFTAQTESYSKGELYSRQTIEWNGSDLHIVTEQDIVRIGEIAGAIHKRRKVKLVLIAGPSSSGKTTFAIIRRGKNTIL